jgi:hypothetical protein
MQIFKGTFQGLRNPKTHSLAHDLTEVKAAQYLIFARLLARFRPCPASASFY